MQLILMPIRVSIGRFGVVRFWAACYTGNYFIYIVSVLHATGCLVLFVFELLATQGIILERGG